MLLHWPPRPGTALFRQGSRKLWLNDELVANAWAFDGFDSALDFAHTRNLSLADHAIEPLEDAEVLEVATQVWKDIEAGKLERRDRRRATAITDADEIRHLTALARNGPDALALLTLLRAEHGARCKRGETFALVIKAMVESKVMGTWAAERYREARDLLLREGLIRQVRPAGPTVAAEYTLVDRVPTPSIAARRN